MRAGSALLPDFDCRLSPWARAARTCGANAAGFTLHLLLAFGTVFAIIFLGESFHRFHAFGIATILAGVALATHQTRPSA